LRSAAHTAERILHFMRQLANDLPRYALASQQLTFPNNLALAGIVVQLEQHALSGLEWRSPTVEAQFATRHSRLQRTQADRDAIRQRPLAQFDQFVRADDDVGQTAPDRLALAQTEQVLCREIEIGDEQPFVERDDGNAETAQDAIGAGRFAAQCPPGSRRGGCSRC
jgi:hypothetical protein